jgi:Fe2+ or Zn2+ uptake regulation protein
MVRPHVHNYDHIIVRWICGNSRQKKKFFSFTELYNRIRERGYGGVSPNTVQRYLDRLVDMGILERHKDRRYNKTLYSTNSKRNAGILIPPRWNKPIGLTEPHTAEERANLARAYYGIIAERNRSYS